MSATMEYAGLTDRGRLRQENEDRWYADPVVGLFLVSDGMGGEPAGALAAQIVAEALPPLLYRRMREIQELSRPEARHCLLHTLTELSSKVREESQDRLGLDGMGATVVLAWIRQQQALIAHSRDSRAYLLRGEKLERLTNDQTVVQLLIECGEITPEDAFRHPARGQLTRYIGMPTELLPEACWLKLMPGDKLLLCSDGLTDMLREAEVRSLLLCDLPPSITCQRLIDAANEAGGADNITAVIVSL